MERLRFAFASCQDQQEGHWTAHEHLAAEDLDLVFFLGDYIYEDDPRTDARPARADTGARRPGRLPAAPRRVPVRSPAPGCARRFPWVCTPDDHEVDNNYAGLNEELPQDGGSGSDPEAFRQRRAAAYQAYYEHLPLRIDRPSGGDAAHLPRRWPGARWPGSTCSTPASTAATRPALARPTLGAPCPEVADPARTMLGDEQEAWLG